MRGIVLPRGRELVYVAMYGLLWFAGYNIALNTAETTLDAGTAAMLVQIAPVIVAIFAGVFLNEGFPPRLLAGSVVALLGSVIIAAGSGSERRIELAGVLVCLLAGVLYAAGMVAQKPVLRTTPALQATWLGCVVGMVASSGNDVSGSGRGRGHVLGPARRGAARAFLTSVVRCA